MVGQHLCLRVPIYTQKDKVGSYPSAHSVLTVVVPSEPSQTPAIIKPLLQLSAHARKVLVTVSAIQGNSMTNANTSTVTPTMSAVSLGTSLDKASLSEVWIDSFTKLQLAIGSLL